MAGFDMTVCFLADGRVEDPIAAAMESFRDSAPDLPDDCRGWRVWNVAEPQYGFVAVPNADPLLLWNSGIVSQTIYWRWPDHVPQRTLWCAGGPRGLLNFELHREIAADYAGGRWDLWQQLSERHPPALPARAFYERHLADPATYPLAEARAEFERQPLIVATRSYPQPEPPYWEFSWGFPKRHDLVTHFAGTREEFVERARRSTLWTDAMINLDGEWLEVPYSESTWEGCGVGVDCWALGEGQAFYIACDDYLENLPPEAQVVRLHCRW